MQATFQGRDNTHVLGNPKETFRFEHIPNRVAFVKGSCLQDIQGKSAMDLLSQAMQFDS